jgi:hypothetical protein
MHRKLAPYLLIASLILAGFAQTPARADDPASSASAAVSGILFEYDADEFASYVIKDSGHVEITFARNTPDAVYSEILNKLQTHAGIKSVLAGRGGPACSRF